MIGIIISQYDDELKEFMGTLDDDVALFFTQVCAIDDLSIPVFFIEDIWNFTETVVAMDDTGVNFLNECPTPIRKYSYHTNETLAQWGSDD